MSPHVSPHDDALHRSEYTLTTSSEDEEDDELLMDPPPPFLHPSFPSRGTKAPKTKHRRLDWQAHVKEKLGNSTFTRRYRMRYSSFCKLVNMIGITVDEVQSQRSTSGNTPIIPELIVAMSLRYLAGGNKAIIADFFGVSDASVDRCIDIFLDKVMACEAIQIMVPATGPELRQIANGFSSVSSAGSKIFDGCVGAIDGWLVEITKPQVPNSGDYYSGHYSCFGLNVIAVCDHRLRFTFMAVAGTGRTNDNRALRHLHELLNWIDNLPPQYFLIGDNAFTLTNKMLVPFSGPQRSHQHKRVYNYFLSQLRIRIEMAFGLMTTKWRIFRRPLDTTLEKTKKIIVVTMILHNFVLMNDGMRLDNRESDIRMQYSVCPLPQRTGLDEENNGFLPTIFDEVQFPAQLEGARRDAILASIVADDLRRPEHNIDRNGE
jgi:DDE superfamily endonuclease